MLLLLGGTAGGGQALRSVGSVAAVTVPSASLALPSGVPPVPVPPEVISRDEAGHATIRAVRIDEPLQIDGRLDERVYDAVPAISNFIQQEPEADKPVSMSSTTVSTSCCRTPSGLPAA